MKSFLKKLLLNVADAAKDTAMGMLPGSDFVVKGVAALLDKDDTNNVEAINNIQQGITTAIQALAPDQVSNLSSVVSGLAKIKEGFNEVKSGLRN